MRLALALAGRSLRAREPGRGQDGGAGLLLLAAIAAALLLAAPGILYGALLAGLSGAPT